MIVEFTDRDFDEIMRTEPVRRWAASFDAARRRTVLRFWLRVLAIVAAIVALAFIYPWDAKNWLVLGVFGIPIGGVVLVAFAFFSLRSSATELKSPLLEAMAAHRGLHFRADDFESPLDPTVKQLLFDRFPFTIECYSDILHGRDAEGRGFAIYEAELTCGRGRTSSIAFSGQIYTFERTSTSPAHTVVWRKGGLFQNYAKPVGGLERVPIANDPDFDRSLRIFSTEPSEARRLLSGTPLSRGLVRLRRKGHVNAYIGPSLFACAIGGRDRFEVGSLFRRTMAHDRARQIFDDILETTGLLRQMEGVVGKGDLR